MIDVAADDVCVRLLFLDDVFYLGEAAGLLDCPVIRVERMSQMQV